MTAATLSPLRADKGRRFVTLANRGAVRPNEPAMRSSVNDNSGAVQGHSPFSPIDDSRDTRPVTRIIALQGDITTLAVDAIVNAANTHLQHGGGVALAISRAGGPIIQDASDDWTAEHGPLTPGTAAVTPAGAMPARIVVHVAGPRFKDGQDNAAMLRTAVESALDAASGQSCRSLALPAISAGIYGYPLEEATRVIVAATQAWCEQNPEVLDEVLLVGFNARVTEAFRTALG